MSKKLYVGNLPYTVNEEELKKLFSNSGEVVAVKLIADRDTGRSKGFAFVEMEEESQAMDVISTYHGMDVGGRNIIVNEARDKRGGRSNNDSNYGGNY